jgi:hypothetical protein
MIVINPNRRDFSVKQENLAEGLPYVFNVIVNQAEDWIYGCGGNGLIFR